MTLYNKRPTHIKYVKNTKKLAEQTKARKVTVNTNTVKGSLYAQSVGVVITDTDITLEFAYINPRPPIENGEVVARVTLPRNAAEGISEAILDTIKKHELKKKG